MNNLKIDVDFNSSKINTLPYLVYGFNGYYEDIVASPYKNLYNHRNVLFIPCNSSISEHDLSKILQIYLSLYIQIYDIMMDTSKTKNPDSRILQALVIQQLRFAKSILLMNEHKIYGQGLLLRNMCEQFITLNWLLNSNKNSYIKTKKGKTIFINKHKDPFYLYKYDSLLDFKEHNIPSYDRPIDKYTRKKGYKFLLNIGLPIDLVKSSVDKISKRFKMPSIKAKASFLGSNAYSTYLEYGLFSEGTHSSLMGVTINNTKNNGKFYVKNSTEYVDATILISVFNFLNKFFNLLSNHFHFINSSSLKEFKSLKQFLLDDVDILTLYFDYWLNTKF